MLQSPPTSLLITVNPLFIHYYANINHYKSYKSFVPLFRRTAEGRFCTWSGASPEKLRRTWTIPPLHLWGCFEMGRFCTVIVVEICLETSSFSSWKERNLRKNMIDPNENPVDRLVNSANN